MLPAHGRVAKRGLTTGTAGDNILSPTTEVRMYAITTGTHWFKGGRWTRHEWEADLFDSAEAAWSMLAAFPSVRADYASVVPV